MSSQSPSLSSRPSSWLARAQQYPWGLLLAVWVGVALVVIPGVRALGGPELVMQVFAGGFSVLIASAVGLWVTERLSRSALQGSVVAAAPVIAGTGVRLLVLFVLLAICMFGLKWDQQAVGFAAIVWYLPMLVVEGWLVSASIQGVAEGRVTRETP